MWRALSSVCCVAPTCRLRARQPRVTARTADKQADSGCHAADKAIPSRPRGRGASLQVAQLRAVALVADVSLHELKKHELQIPVQHDVFLPHLLAQLPSETPLAKQAVALLALLKPQSSSNDVETEALLATLQHSDTSDAVASLVLKKLLSTGRFHGPAVAAVAAALARCRQHGSSDSSQLVQQLLGVEVRAPPPASAPEVNSLRSGFFL